MCPKGEFATIKRMREWDVISPLDGRYREQLAALREQAGPAAFARARVRAEVC